MPRFQVWCYDGANKPDGRGYVAIEAESAQDAAEKLCGEPLTLNGKHLRALVHTSPPKPSALPFYRRPTSG
jgi:hypothetical protein